MPTGDPQPVPNLSLMAWEPVVPNARVGATRLPDTATDQSGRFRIEASSNVLYLETAPGSPFKFICPSYPHHGGDVYVLDASWSGEPWFPGLSLLGIFGKVTERVEDLVQPVVGATVTLDDGSRDPPTTTNANGFYSICSVTGADFSRVVTARKTGYRPSTVGILWGWDWEVNFTLGRN
jgi:hypothetical protein